MERKSAHPNLGSPWSRGCPFQKFLSLSSSWAQTQPHCSPAMWLEVRQLTSPSLLPPSEMSPDALGGPRGTVGLVLDHGPLPQLLVLLFLCQCRGWCGMVPPPRTGARPALGLSPVLMLSPFPAPSLALALVLSLPLLLALSLSLALSLLLVAVAIAITVTIAVLVTGTLIVLLPLAGVAPTLAPGQTWLPAVISLTGILGLTTPLSGLKLLLCGTRTGCSGYPKVSGGQGRAGQQEGGACNVVALSKHAQDCAVPGAMQSPGHSAGLSPGSCSLSWNMSGSPSGSSLPYTSQPSLPRRETEAACWQL